MSSPRPAESAEVEAAPAACDLEEERRKEVLVALSRLDVRLCETLRQGDIRLLRSAWLDQQPDTYRLQFRQELEKLPDALLPPKDAVALVRRRNRGAGALTYGARSIEPTPPCRAGLPAEPSRQRTNERAPSSVAGRRV